MLCSGLYGVESVRIWDKAPYSAFTDLIVYKGRFVCAFREAPTHHAEDGLGTIRVLRSKDGKAWESAAVLSRAGSDLRDPKLSLTPKGELMMAVGAVAPGAKGAERIQTLAYFSRDAVKWGGETRIGEPGFWLWRVTWFGGKAYSVAYQTGRTGVLRVYVSSDGRHFETLVDDLHVPDFGNEATIAFDHHGTAYCFVRRDSGSMSAMWGVSKKAPYTDWTWTDLGRRVGSPHVMQAPDGRFIGVVRYFEGNVRRVSIIELDPAGKMTELQALPSSNGDSGYAGMAWKDGELWTSYYSTHENKRTSIFVARWRRAR